MGCPVYSEPEKAASEADIVLLTTPDRVIEEVCQSIAAKKGFQKGQVVLHTSGAHSSNILVAARNAGAFALSLHPLQTFPSLSWFAFLAGHLFAVEGDEKALPFARELVDAMEGKMLTIPTEMKPLTMRRRVLATI